MKKQVSRFSIILTVFLLWTLIFNSLPTGAQGDIVSSDDISGGSSVFVFRRSRAAAQSKFAGKTTAKRNKAQKDQTRNSVQAKKGKSTTTRKRAPKVDPGAIATLNKPAGKPDPKKPDTAVASAEQASNVFAGAAETFLEQGNVDKALSFFIESTKLNPNNLAAKEGLSEAYTIKANSVYSTDGAFAAVPLYELAIKFNDRNDSAYAGIGTAYDELEQSDKAFENYEKALTINPDLNDLYSPVGIVYFQKGEIARADDFLSRAVAVNAEDDQAQYLLGLIRYKQNRTAEAQAAFEKSLRLKPTAESHYYLGEVFDRLDRVDDSIREYNRAIALNPKYAEAWFDLGAAYYNRKRWDDAEKSYNRAIELKNDNYLAHEYLGDVYRQKATDTVDPALRLRLFRDAEASYQLAVVLATRPGVSGVDPALLAELHSKHGFVLGRISKWDNAVVALNKAVGNNSDAVDYTNIGWAYYNAAQANRINKSDAEAAANLAKAKENLEKAVALDPRAAGAYMNLGVTLSDLGEFSAAAEALKRCIELRKDWFSALNELGLAYRGLNKLDDAAERFKEAVKLSEKNYSDPGKALQRQLFKSNLTSSLYNLSLTEKQRGKDKEAKKAQDRLRELDPNLANALEAAYLMPVNRVTNKVQQNNPLKRLPKLPY